MSTMHSRQGLTDILLQQGYVLPAQVPADIETKNYAELYEKLVMTGVLTPAQLLEAVAIALDIPYVDLTDVSIDTALFNKLPAKVAFKYSVLPYSEENGVLNVVVSDPFDLTIIDRLEHISKSRVQILLSTKEAIKEALRRSQGANEVLNELSTNFTSVDKPFAAAVAIDYEGDNERQVTRLINTIIVAALQKRASDIHIEAFAQHINIKYRIDGVLSAAMEPIDISYHAALVSRIKVMADMDIAEKRVAQDSRMKLRVEARDVDFRVSILPGVFGEDVVIRILDKSYLSGNMHNLKLSHLGFDAAILESFQRAIHEPYGMILITGPTGSGKTTTLYAALSELNTKEEKIITIEDPVEYQLDGVVQIPVNEKKGVTFAGGLRSILRHDPDKIMIGEIRDSETVQIAVQSALTGHLVFTTVHANNSLDVIGRFEHMGVNIYNFVSSLNCVMAQRLVRTLCQQCREEVAPDLELIHASALDVDEYSAFPWYRGKGCNDCNHTGFRGRTAIIEYLRMTPRIRELITQRKSIAELQQAARDQGMITLREAALDKFKQGLTTLAEINRVTIVE